MDTFLNPELFDSFIFHENNRITHHYCQILVFSALKTSNYCQQTIEIKETCEKIDFALALRGMS